MKAETYGSEVDRSPSLSPSLFLTFPLCSTPTPPLSIGAGPRLLSITSTVMEHLEVIDMFQTGRKLFVGKSAGYIETSRLELNDIL